jgi:HEAT repeat protein
LVFRVALAVALPLAAPAATPDGSARDDDPQAWQEALARTRRAAAALARPLTAVERYPALRPFGHLGVSDAEPHLDAVRTLGSTGVSAGAYALVAVLGDPGFPYRVEAAEALRRVPHAVAIGPLLAVLEAADPVLRSRAARALGAIAVAGVADPEAFEPVSARLRVALQEDPHPEVRAASFTALLNTGRADDFGEAFRLADRDHDPLVQCEMFRARNFFARLSEKADAIDDARSRTRAFLVERPESERSRDILRRAVARSRYRALLHPLSRCPDTAVEAAHGLAYLEDPSARVVLGALASSAGDAPLRSAAVTALAALGGEPALVAAIAALEDERWSVRRAAVDALVELDHPRGYAALARLATRGAPLERRAAVRALAEVPARSAALVAALGDPAVLVRVAADQALLKRPERVVRGEEALADDAAWERPAWRAGSSEEERAEARRRAERNPERWRAEQAAAEKALAAALSADDGRVRHRAARILAAYPGEASFALLLETLQSGHPPQAGLAAFALGLRGEPAARAALERAARGDDPELALVSVRALQDLGARESLPALRALGRSAADEEVQAAARRASVLLQGWPPGAAEAGRD